MRIKNNRGFTILELLIVISVAIIISNIATKSFSNLEIQNLNKACLKLQSEVREAKANAIMEGTNYRILFDIENNLYMVYKMNDIGKYVYQKTVYFTDGVKLYDVNDLNRNIVYTPVGTTSNACTIVLMAKHYSVDVTVNVGSGRIEIKEFSKL